MGEVIKLDNNDAEDIVLMLRKTADRIEEGDLPKGDLAVFAMKADEAVFVFGWGQKARSMPELFTLNSYINALLIRNY